MENILTNFANQIPNSNRLMTTREGLKGERDFVIAAQYLSLPTRNYQESILTDEIDPLYRIFGKSTESIDHVVYGC